MRKAVSVPLQKTKTPGIYSKGNRYIVVYRDPSGKQRKKSARTMSEARNLKASLRADIDRGEYRNNSRLTFAEFAPQWASTYKGRTSRGIRPETLADYRRDLGIGKEGELLGDGAIAFFGRMRLTSIQPQHIKDYAASLGHLRPNSVRLALAPVKLLLATAFEDGLIRSNPSAGVKTIQLQEGEGDSETEQAKALTAKELAALLNEIPEQHRLFFTLLSQTGLRISEGIALQWGDLDFGNRRLKVRRRLYKGRLAPPKSKYGRRDIPLSTSLTQALWTLGARSSRSKTPVSSEDSSSSSAGADKVEGLIFSTRTGTAFDPSNLAAKVMKPAAARAGVPWASFHTLRHTCATLLFRNALNAKQVQAWLGHHSPAFTLSVYVHLLPDDLPSPDFWPSVSDGATAAVAERATEGQPDEQKQAEVVATSPTPLMPLEQGFPVAAEVARSHG